MDPKNHIPEILAALEESYPLAECSLNYHQAWELLVSVRLAAQCTDARVNLVTPALFAAFPDAEAMAAAEPEQVEPYIRSCGFYHGKARDIVLAARMLVTEYGGILPDRMEDLLRLPGVGRKSANLLLGDVYGVPGSVVVDTHCIRLTNRIGLVKTKDPVRIEFTLRGLLPPEKSNDFCHRCVLHGRAVCTAAKPDCAHCSVRRYCITGSADPSQPASR